MRLGLFNVSLCVVEPVFIVEQVCEGKINPKQEMVLIEKGRNSESNLEMVNCLLCLALGSIYRAKSNMTFRDLDLLAFWEEIDRAGYSVFCGVESFSK